MHAASDACKLIGWENSLNYCGPRATANPMPSIRLSPSPIGSYSDLAHQRLRRAPKITLLDTGVLVNECYLRLVKVGGLHVDDRAHFLGYAGRVMRSIVVDFARERLAQRRGADAPHIAVATDIPDPAAAAEEEVVRVDEALQELAKLDPRLVQVVELKYFGGLNNEEIAAALGIAERSVRRDWQKARVLLHESLKP